jgi:hypothetical protein
VTTGDLPPSPLPPIAEPVTRGRIPVRGTVSEAFQLLRQYPKATLLPQAVIGIPVAIAAAVATVFVFLAAFPEEDVNNVATFSAEASGAALFAMAVIVAAEALFAQVARGATIVAVASAARGRPIPLVEALDPAFTRLGGLVGLVLILGAIGALAFITIVGIILLPYVLFRLALVFDTYMLEGVGVNQALRRSWQVMSGNMIRLVGVIALSVLCALPILLLFSLFGAPTEGNRTTQVLVLAVLGIVRGAAFVPFVAFLTACTTLYYLKAKAAEDAYDAYGSA